MSVPEIFIREDGKGFVVRKGGVGWVIYLGTNLVEAVDPQTNVYGLSDTIMGAVDNALAKMRKEKK